MDATAKGLLLSPVSNGAKYVDEKGNPTLVGDKVERRPDDAGAMASGWNNAHGRGGLAGARGQGFWLLPATSSTRTNAFLSLRKLAGFPFENEIGDKFDWEVVPAPLWPGDLYRYARRRLPRSFKIHPHPEEVARFIEFMASEESIRNGRTYAALPGAHRYCRKGYFLRDYVLTLALPR